MTSIGQHREQNNSLRIGSEQGDFVLEKSIFSNIFDKDIRRVFIYKKAERLAKAIHLITPAFQHTPSLRDRIDAVAIGLVDAAILSPAASRGALSRELLALSSVLSIARTGGMLSPMNAELIAKEAHTLLQEVAAYEEPRLFLDEMPSLAELAKAAPQARAPRAPGAASEDSSRPNAAEPESFYKGQSKGQTKEPKGQDKGRRKGQIKDIAKKESRRDAILLVIRTKGNAYIKDISTVIRDMSEKTIQRELATLVSEGILTKKGVRRWTSYALA